MDDLRATCATFDGEALISQLAALSAIGLSADGGVTRTSFSKEFVAGRDLVASYCSDAGLSVRIDPLGNLIAESEPKDLAKPAIIVGSHLDTVVEAGLLDGAYGVIAGLGAIAAIKRAGINLSHRLVLAGFINEEGADGTAAMLGSKACVGRIGPDDLNERDMYGTSVRDLVAGIGGDPKRYQEADLSPNGAIAAYLELHIEQGPVLERAGMGIGIVTAITGRVLLDIECTGVASHAGTTPMLGRADALVAAARIVTEIDDIARRGVTRVGTAGVLEITGAARNTIPGRVRVAAEFRDDDTASMENALGQLRNFAQELSSSSGVPIAIHVLDTVKPCPTDPLLRQALIQATESYGLKHLALSSGAGHDAQSFYGRAPIGMIFVPSLGGISHSAKEATADDELIAGGAVLAGAIVAVDRALVGSPERSGVAGGQA